MQPDCNCSSSWSYAIHAQLVDYPARAGLQPNDINDLYVCVDLNLETAAASTGYLCARTVVATIERDATG
jgi:hypothetical protein